MSSEPVEASLESLDRALGVPFHDAALREAALTHRSYAFEHATEVTNERLEFLGDSVLGLVVTDMAYTSFPDLPEGALAKLRAAIVNMVALADVARSLGLGDIVLLGKGEELSGGRDKASILADALEAVFGAIYLDRGLEVSRELIERLFRPRMEAYVRGEGSATTRPSCRSSRRRRCARCRSTGWPNGDRTTRRSSRPWCSWPARRWGVERVAPRRKPNNRRHEKRTRASPNASRERARKGE